MGPWVLYGTCSCQPSPSKLHGMVHFHKAKNTTHVPVLGKFLVVGSVHFHSAAKRQSFFCNHARGAEARCVRCPVCQVTPLVSSLKGTLKKCPLILIGFAKLPISGAEPLLHTFWRIEHSKWAVFAPGWEGTRLHASTGSLALSEIPVHFSTFACWLANGPHRVEVWSVGSSL